MTRRGLILGSLMAGAGIGQQDEFVCPMDPEVRSAKAGRCPRCGMTLVAGLPAPVEYPMDVRMVPAAPRAGQRVQLRFAVRHPMTGTRIREFEVVHEKLLHLFVVSQDLSFFRHEHPQLGRDGVFQLEMEFPAPGMYRMLGDFYPRHGTPQLVESTVIVPGGGITAGTRLSPDLEPKNGVSAADGTITADCGDEDAPVLSNRAGGRIGEVPGRVESYAGGQRGPGRYDSRSSVSGRGRAADAVQHDLSAARGLPALGTVSAPGSCEYGAVRCGGGGVEVGAGIGARLASA